jgi:hypothetical protein
MPLQFWGDAECDSVVIYDIAIAPKADLGVPEHQAFKLLVEDLSIPPAPFALALVLGKSTLNSWWKGRCR